VTELYKVYISPTVPIIKQIVSHNQPTLCQSRRIALMPSCNSQLTINEKIRDISSQPWSAPTSGAGAARPYRTLHTRHQSARTPVLAKAMAS